MVSITAQNILDENNYTVSDISKVNLERLIDNATRYVNLHADRSIATMAGTAESKTVSMTDEESAVVKPVIILLIRAYKDRGPNTAISGLSVSQIISDPQYSLFKDAVDKGVERLKNVDREWKNAFI